jgi:hypothetical protein
MKQLTEIDCNEELWNALTMLVGNGWGNFENELRFAYCTQDQELTEDDVDCWLGEVFPLLDTSKVMEVKADSLREYTIVDGWRYFAASVVIYRSKDDERI